MSHTASLYLYPLGSGSLGNPDSGRHQQRWLHGELIKPAHGMVTHPNKDFQASSKEDRSVSQLSSKLSGDMFRKHWVVINLKV